MKILSYVFQFVRLFLNYLGLGGGNCLYYPSCSQVISDSLQNKGFIRSIPLIFGRILTCNTVFKKFGKKWQY